MLGGSVQGCKDLPPGPRISSLGRTRVLPQTLQSCRRNGNNMTCATDLFMLAQVQGRPRRDARAPQELEQMHHAGACTPWERLSLITRCSPAGGTGESGQGSMGHNPRQRAERTQPHLEGGVLGLDGTPDRAVRNPHTDTHALQARPGQRSCHAAAWTPECWQKQRSPFQEVRVLGREGLGIYAEWGAAYMCSFLTHPSPSTAVPAG